MTPELARAIASASLPCFLCSWILEDLDRNGKLTGYPLDYMNAGIFPASGKTRHLELERASLDNRGVVIV